jgi:AraC-like DNA-binding protein
MLRGGFRPVLAQRGGDSRPGASYGRRLLPAAARVAFPPRQRSDFTADRRPHDISGEAEWRRLFVQWRRAMLVLDGDHADILLGMLPPIVHIRKEADRAALRWSLDRMMEELRDPQPGGFLVVDHLVHMMLVQALRLHLAEGLRGGVGWLFALADRQMGAAINAMHDDPAHRWTLQSLAERAGMSRTTFTLKCKETVGTSPMDYLTRWRMLVAGDRLANSTNPISVIARSLGYESESAFSTAFKRVIGCSPRQYCRGRNRTPPSRNEEEPGRANRLEPVAS